LWVVIQVCEDLWEYYFSPQKWEMGKLFDVVYHPSCSFREVAKQFDPFECYSERKKKKICYFRGDSMFSRIMKLDRLKNWRWVLTFKEASSSWQNVESSEKGEASYNIKENFSHHTHPQKLESSEKSQLHVSSEEVPPAPPQSWITRKISSRRMKDEHVCAFHSFIGVGGGGGTAQHRSAPHFWSEWDTPEKIGDVRQITKLVWQTELVKLIFDRTKTQTVWKIKSPRTLDRFCLNVNGWFLCWNEDQIECSQRQ
jgi:hypothetical protein